MANKHGLDTMKFEKWLNRINRDIDNLTPEQFKNELFRMARETKSVNEKDKDNKPYFIVMK